MAKTIEILEGAGLGSGAKEVLNLFVTDIVGDKDVKTAAAVAAIEALTGVTPDVDRSDPEMNVIQFRREHRDQIEALLDKSSKYYTDDTGRRKVSNVKLDAGTLYGPLILKRAFPYLLGAALIGFAIGRVVR